MDLSQVPVPPPQNVFASIDYLEHHDRSSTDSESSESEMPWRSQNAQSNHLERQTGSSQELSSRLAVMEAAISAAAREKGLSVAAPWHVQTNVKFRAMDSEGLSARLSAYDAVIAGAEGLDCDAAKKLIKQYRATKEDLTDCGARPQSSHMDDEEGQGATDEADKWEEGGGGGTAPPWSFDEDEDEENEVWMADRLGDNADSIVSPTPGYDPTAPSLPGASSAGIGGIAPRSLPSGEAEQVKSQHPRSRLEARGPVLSCPGCFNAVSAGSIAHRQWAGHFIGRGLMHSCSVLWDRTLYAAGEDGEYDTVAVPGFSHAERVHPLVCAACHAGLGVYHPAPRRGGKVEEAPAGEMHFFHVLVGHG